MTAYSEDPDLKADGDPTATEPRDRAPKVSKAARTFTLNQVEEEGVVAGLFGVTEIFRVPVTNNYPLFEGGDPNKPAYHVAEFAELIIDCFLKDGWTPPKGSRWAERRLEE